MKHGISNDRMAPRLARIFVMAAVLAGTMGGLATPAGAQMLPQQGSAKKEDTAGKAEPQRSDVGFYQKYLGEKSPYRGAIIAAVSLFVLVTLYKFSTRRIRKYLKEQAFKAENARRFMRTWKSVWSFTITILVLISLSGSLGALGISAGFLGMMLGWSLQAPVTGMAAWLMIVVKKPFKIGDRVIIGGTIGDVTDITLTHVVLNQVGGTIGGEEQSGRGVLIPNATLFAQIITNYTLAEKYMLDEVVVRLTFESDLDLAKEICLQAAREVTKDIIAEIKTEPFFRMEFFDAGVFIRLRYQTVGAERQKTSSQIVEKILMGFKANYPKVKFAYPHSVIRHRTDESEGENA